jgi:hypothetical protein
MRLLLLCFLLVCMLIVAGQEVPETIVFTGYIFTEDSVPAENAHLINYRDTKIVATDSTGRFTIFVQEGDSLMINHISLQARVIHANKLKPGANKIYVGYRTYQLDAVATRGFERDYHNFEQNMKKLNRELQNLGYGKAQTARGNYDNPYNPQKTNPGLTTTVGELIRLFKKK